MFRGESAIVGDGHAVSRRPHSKRNPQRSELLVEHVPKNSLTGPPTTIPSRRNATFSEATMGPLGPRSAEPSSDRAGSFESPPGDEENDRQDSNGGSGDDERDASVSVPGEAGPDAGDQ